MKTEQEIQEAAEQKSTQSFDHPADQNIYFIGFTEGASFVQSDPPKELKPLSEITDEDKKELAKIAYSKMHDFHQEARYYGQTIVDAILENNGNHLQTWFSPNIWLNVYKFLESKGYHLP